MRCIVILLLFLAMPLRAERVAEWRQDLDALASELVRVHPRFRECGLPAEFEARRATLGSNIGNLTDAQVVVEIQHLLASVGDGHTLLWPFGMKRGELLHLPVMFWEFDEGFYVIDATDRALVGRRVAKIGSVDVADILRRLEPYVSHDNDEQLRWAAPFYATLTDFLLAIGATDDRNRAALVFDDGTSATLDAVAIDPEQLQTKLVAPKSAPLYLSRAATPFWTKELAGGVLYIQVNAMNDAPDETLAAFGTSLRSQLRGRKAAIVDLRLNNGGEASKADELLRTLIAADTNGVKLAVLTSRMTFSAAQTFATRVDQWTGAIFVGQPTGSRPNHYGNERTFKLPTSGVRGTISSGFNQPVTARDERATIVPDITVPLAARDYFAGRDPALDEALKALGFH